MSDDEREENSEKLAPAPVLRDEQLRPALELAFAVAVAGQRLKPPIVAPSQLKRFLNFQKLPTNALATVRRVVEADDVFRQRVAAVATDELATELGAVWLRQADGWHERVAKLVALADEADDRDDQEREDRTVQRRLTLAETALTKARAELAVATAEVERDRARRLEAESTAAASAKKIAAAAAETKLAQLEVTRLKEHLATAQVRIDQLVGERDRARNELATARRSLDDALAATVATTERATAAETLLRQRDAKSLAQTTLGASAAVSASPPADPSVLLAASRALGDTAGALRDLASALDRTSEAVRPHLPTSRPQSPPQSAAAQAGVTPAATQRGASQPTPKKQRSSSRAPLAIPGGLVSDSTAAAEHLLKTPGVTAIVDGYNVAKLGWPGFSLADQRDRLLDGLEDLVRRLGCHVVVVFDGADVPGVSTGRRLIRVRFSTPGITADQEIIALVVDSSSEQAMIVVTNDQEIVRGVRTAGANTLTSDQFLAVIRR